MTGDLRSVFDADWYLAKYLDVEMSGLEPLDHYLRYGERLGRKPCPVFDPLFYGECYPDVIESGASPFTHFVTLGKREGKRGHPETIQQFMQQLWRREHIADCLAALASFTQSNQPDHVRSAAWVLARWFAFQEDWHYCVHWLRLYYQQPAPKVPWPVIQLVYCEALSRTGELAQAEQQAVALKKRFPDYYDAYLALSNIYLSQLAALPPGDAAAKQALALNQQRIDMINALFARNGLSLIEVDASSTPLSSLSLLNSLSLDTINAAGSKAKETNVQETEGHDTGVVSVIVPVFNAEWFLATALKSLAVQSFSNLEVLIVDDASTDATRSVAEQFVAQDARFKLLCLPYNQGAYAARNHGLKHASGAYITVHDADDWSHPEKLACQVAAFEANPAWVANTSDMVRCTTDLRFGRWRLPNIPKGGWIYRNTSSLMFKRKVFETLGYWDRVRCTGDTEYFHRIIAGFGREAFGEVLGGVPLSFCRHEEGSLSQNGPLHLITHEKGVRRDYMRAAKAWHASAQTPQELFMPESPAKRPFISPSLNLANPANR